MSITTCLPPRAVERLDSHQRDGVDGGGQHHEIGFRNTLLETHDPVRKAQLQRLGSVFFGAFDPEYLLCDAVVAKGQGERASDKAQTRNQYFHKTIYLFNNKKERSPPGSDLEGFSTPLRNIRIGRRPISSSFPSSQRSMQPSRSPATQRRGLASIYSRMRCSRVSPACPAGLASR